MGLDSYIYKQKIKPELEQAFDNLIGETPEQEDVLYWRKNYDLLAWFRENLCDIDNCKCYEVSKELFEKLLKDLESEKLIYYNDEDCSEMIRDMEEISKILKETDFKTTKFFFYNWW